MTTTKSPFPLALILGLFYHIPLYLSECKRNSQLTPVSSSLKALLTNFASFEVTTDENPCESFLGTFQTTPLVVGNAIDLNRQNSLTITELNTGRKLLEINGYPHTALIAKRNDDFWLLGNDDGTHMFLPTKQVSEKDFTQLSQEQTKLLMMVHEQFQRDKKVTPLPEAQTKLFSTFSPWFQLVLRKRYGVTFASVVD